MKNKKNLFDSILVVVLFLIAMIMIFTNRSSNAGSFARVEIDGKTVADIRLEKNAEYSFNDGKNIIAVEDGFIYMKSADCKGQNCVKQGKKNKTGQSIICLPNRIKVTIKQYDGGIDLVI